MFYGEVEMRKEEHSNEALSGAALQHPSHRGGIHQQPVNVQRSKDKLDAEGRRDAEVMSSVLSLGM